MRIRGLGLAALVALMVLTAGCGKSKSSNESVATTRASGSGSQSSTTAGGSATTGAGNGGGNGSSGSVSGLPDAQCINFAIKWAQLASQFGGAAAGSGNSNLKSELSAMQGSVPSEIKDDFNTVATAYSDYMQAVQSAGSDPTKLATAASKIDTPDVQKASANIDKWTSAHCKN